MTKTYKINGKEIHGFQGRWDGTVEGKINELLEALSDNNDECNCCGWDDHGYTHEPGCNLKEALSDKEKNERKYFECSKHRIAGWGGCSECNQKTSEPKQEECKTCDCKYQDWNEPCLDGFHGEDRPKQCIHGIYLVDNTICDKCLKTKKCVTCGENDHDYCTPKQSTSLKEMPLRDKIDFIQDRLLNDHITTEDSITEILEVFQSHLVKEIKQSEPLRLEGESPDFTQGQEWTMRQVIKIINNIK